METAPSLPEHRLAIGQLLVRLLHHFRTDIFELGSREQRFDTIRPAHLGIWGNIGTGGIRLTDLADRATLSLPACSEVVTQLEEAGYLERRPDPQDGRAKLIYPTSRGRDVLCATTEWVARIEEQWRQLLPAGDFEQAANTLDRLVETLTTPMAEEITLS